jgi:hypothetical protein
MHRSVIRSPSFSPLLPRLHIYEKKSMHTCMFSHLMLVDIDDRFVLTAVLPAFEATDTAALRAAVIAAVQAGDTQTAPHISCMSRYRL